MPKRLKNQNVQGSRSFRSKEVQAALVAGGFAVIVAIIGGLFLLAKNDPQPKNPTPAPIISNQNAPQSVVQNATQSVVVNNQNSLPPRGPADEKPRLQLQLFALNEQDSLYRRCSDAEPCDWASDETSWQPSPEAQMIMNLRNGADMWADTGVKVGDKRYIGFDKKFHANPDEYLNRLSPTFDLVISNSGGGTAVLTGIDVFVIRSEPFAQGDGEERATLSHVLPVLHRYDVNIPARYRDVETPFHFSVPANPPLSLRTNDPARFQISIQSPAEAAWIYGMYLKLHFGPNTALATKRFQLKF